MLMQTLTFTTLLMLLSLAGCRSPGDAGARSLQWTREELGRSIEGRPIEAFVTGSGPDVTLLIASIHGNEPAGTPLLQTLMERLHQRVGLECRTVVVILVANPDGLHRSIRTNASGVDLNRNFLASNFRKTALHGPSALSEPESRALLNLLERHQPDRVVSIHQPLAQIDYDGPARHLAQAMGLFGDLPVKRIGSRPGSLGSYVGLNLNRPIITLELPHGAHRLDPETLWSRYGAMLLQAIVYPETLAR